MDTEASIKEIMNREAITVEKSDPISKVSELMSENKIGGVVVVSEDGYPEGIVTERDVLDNVITKGQDPEKVKAEDIMSSNIVSLESDRTIAEGAQLMIDNGMRRLLIIEDEKPVGFINLSNILDAYSDLVEEDNSKQHVSRQAQGEMLGFCESCGEYKPLVEYDGRWVCDECRGAF